MIDEKYYSLFADFTFCSKQFLLKINEKSANPFAVIYEKHQTYINHQSQSINI